MKKNSNKFIINAKIFIFTKKKKLMIIEILELVCKIYNYKIF